MNPKMTDSQALACDLTAIPAPARAEHVLTAPQLFAAAQEVQELPNGIAIRFLSEPGRLLAIAKFVENEMLCCPFFSFALEVEPDKGAYWLRLTGGEGVKELLQTMLFEAFENKAALRRLIHTGGDPQLDELVEGTSLPVLSTPLRHRPSP